MTSTGAGVVAALVAVASLVLPAPSVASAAEPDPNPGDTNTCQPAAAPELPFEADASLDPEEYPLIVAGGGFGHGVGMSQYGAQGAALLGCTHQTILGTYYPGSSIADIKQRSVISVSLRRIGRDPTNVKTTSSGAGGHDLDWVACDLAGASCPVVATQPAGSTWTILPQADGSFQLLAGEAIVWQGGDIETRLRLIHDGTVIRVVETGRRLKWGFLEFDYTTSENGVTYVNQYITGDGAPAMDHYLWGLAEVPVTWEPAAQRAQAIAARSYAEATIRGREAAVGRHDPGGYLNNYCRCDLYATVADQYYLGWDRENADDELDGGWLDAVNATSGKAMKYDGSVVAAFYSSSHGGSSEDVQHVWGTAIPYLPAVNTSRWEQAANNPHQRWSLGFTANQLNAAFGLLSVDEVVVEERGPGGRPSALKGGGVVVRGTDADDQKVELRMSGEGLRKALGVRSARVYLNGDQPPPPDVAVQRAAGPDRIQTAIEASKIGWNRSDVVVIARSDIPADALAGSGLAGALDAPLLISPPEALPASVTTRLTTLQAKRVILLGGEAALSEHVGDQLIELGVETVDRVAGPDRVATAAAIARELAPQVGENAIVVRGIFPEHPEREWVDALAVASLAAETAARGRPWPVLVVGDTVPKETAEVLAELGVIRVFIAGGAATVPVVVEDQLREMDIIARRMAGDDRYGTSRAAADWTEPESPVLVIATGQNFPDGLAAGPLAAKLGGTLLLVPSEHLAEQPPWRASEHLDWLAALDWNAPSLVVVGGEQAVSPQVEALIRASLGP